MSGYRTLRAGPLRLVVDPARGAEVRSLRWRDDELLFQAPWPQAPTGPAPLDEDAWTAAWPGGWQLLVPSAGVSSTVGGRRHGYHGDASVRAAELVDSDETSLAFRWDDDHGLEIERSYWIDPTGVRARCRLRNTSAEPVPYQLVEHLVLGGPFAAEGVQIELPGGELVPQSWEGDEQAGGPWPVVAGEDWSELGAAPLSRFGVVRGLPAGHATVRAPGGPAVTLHWSFDALPHLWLWQERRGATAPPWDGVTECLAIEPSSAPSADGLAAAHARGEAAVLQPGGRADSWLELSVRA